MTPGSLWNHYRDEVNDYVNETADKDNEINSDKTVKSKSFEYKKKMIRSAPNNISIINTEVVVLLIYLSSFWRFLNLPLITCEKELDLLWSKDCIISEISRTHEKGGANLADATFTTGATFRINHAELYVPVVTLEHMKNLSKCQERMIYTTGNLIGYLNHQNCYKLVSIDLSRQISTTN